MDSTENTMTQELNGEKVWNLIESGAIGFERAIDIAANVKCCDNEWTLPCDGETAAAALHTLGEDIFDYMGSDAHDDRMEYFARNGAYHRIRQGLEALYPNASGSHTDPWTAESFSECYKDRCGCRPSGRYTGAEMRDYLRTMGPLEENA